MTLAIHQLIHGYRRGHQLLASSIRLSSKSNELTKRLSDLSGLLTRESNFAPYLTSYPLPDNDFHALAKTWPDVNASRAGCVLTHTLLIPSEYWAWAANHRTLTEYFKRPEGELESYQTELNYEASSSTHNFDAKVFPKKAAEFVSKYFGQGLRPIIWFDEDLAEEVFWQILNSIWPSLRRRFACCTFSLQPRQLDEKPFDLLFAPTYVYSRFNKIAEQNLIDPAKHGEYDGHEDSEPWTLDFAKYIFDRCQESSLAEEMKELGQLLGDEPTSVRNVFRLDELRRRSKSSSTAAVGAMDVLSSLAPDSEAAVDYKKKVVSLAIESAQRDKANDSLKSFYLISERLQQTSYSLIKPSVARMLSDQIALTVERMPEVAIETGERLFSRFDPESDSAFRAGLIQGLANLSYSDSEQLAVLHRYPVPAGIILSAKPEIGIGYLRAMQKTNNTRTASADLAAWVALIDDKQVRKNLRTALLPELRSDDEAELAESLLSDIQSDEVMNALDTLCETTSGFPSSSLLHVFIERIAIEHPMETRQWAAKTECWSAGAASLSAASFSKDEKGLGEVLSFSVDKLKLSEIIISYIDCMAAPSLPLWFRDYAKNHADFLLPIMLRGSERSVEIILQKIFSQLRDVPIACEKALIDRIGDFSHSSVGPILIDQTMKSAIAAFVSGAMSWNTYESFSSAAWANKWLSKSTSWDIEGLLIPLCNDYSSWSRAWSWIGKMPASPIPGNVQILPKLMESLISARKPNWPWEERDTIVWMSVLQQLSLQGDASSYLRLCAYALDFAFRNTQFPLSQVVVDSFWPVYSELLRTSAPSHFSNLIFSILSVVDLDWDKAKDLRKKLVKSFITSSWPPGDLALAIKNRDTLRKIFKRIIRYPHGSNYVTSMIADLKKRGDETATGASNYLDELQKAPYFYEPWD